MWTLVPKDASFTALVLLAVSGAAEAESATAFFTPRELESYQLPDLPDRNEARDFFGATGGSFQALFSAENLPTLSVFVVGTLGSMVVEDEIQQYFAEKQRFEDVGEVGEWLGNPYVLVASYGGFFVAGRLSANERFKRMTYSLAQGFVVNNAIAIGLKYAVGRERPNEESNTSFPSGHTSNMFTGAVIAGHYYGRKAYVPLCALAIFVGLTRIEENAHWLSDVVAGAGIGYLVGHSVLHANGLHVHGDRVTWAPTFPRGGGVGVQIHVKL